MQIPMKQQQWLVGALLWRSAYCEGYHLRIELRLELDVDPIVEISPTASGSSPDNAVLGTRGRWCDPIIAFIGRVLEHECQMLNELVVAQRRVRDGRSDQPLGRVHRGPHGSRSRTMRSRTLRQTPDGAVFDLVSMKCHDGSGPRQLVKLPLSARWRTAPAPGAVA